MGDREYHYVLCDVKDCPGYHCNHVAKELAELRVALLAARADAERYRVLRTDAVLDGQFENEAAFDAWVDPVAKPTLGQEWVSRVTASDGPDVIGSDVSQPTESRRAYFARIAAECNEIRSQLLAARRETEALRGALQDIGEATVTHDPEPFRNRVIAILAALAATPEEK